MILLKFMRNEVECGGINFGNKLRKRKVEQKAVITMSSIINC